MKKIIPALALLGSAAALVIYKMKKDEQKRIIDLDQGLLYDDDDTCCDDEEIEEGPISNPKACCEDVKEVLKDAMDDAHDVVDDVVEEFKKKAKKMSSDGKEIIEDFDEKFKHLLKKEVVSLKEKSSEIMNVLAESGDVHEHERPVQHKVVFATKDDLENFKNTVVNKGFVITKGESDLELIVLHISPVDTDKLISNVLYLADIAKANNGTYIGWESKIVY